MLVFTRDTVAPLIDKFEQAVGETSKLTLKISAHDDFVGLASAGGIRVQINNVSRLCDDSGVVFFDAKPVGQLVWAEVSVSDRAGNVTVSRFDLTSPDTITNPEGFVEGGYLADKAVSGDIVYYNEGIWSENEFLEWGNALPIIKPGWRKSQVSESQKGWECYFVDGKGKTRISVAKKPL